jgi:hypothetical protein
MQHCKADWSTNEFEINRSREYMKFVEYGLFFATFTKKRNVCNHRKNIKGPETIVENGSSKPYSH